MSTDDVPTPTELLTVQRGGAIDYCIACRRGLCHRHALTHEQDPEKGLCRDLWPGP